MNTLQALLGKVLVLEVNDITVQTSGPTPQVASSAVHKSTQANKERMKRKRGEEKKKKNIERDLNPGRQLHRLWI